MTPLELAREWANYGGWLGNDPPDLVTLARALIAKHEECLKWQAMAERITQRCSLALHNANVLTEQLAEIVKAARGEGK